MNNEKENNSGFVIGIICCIVSFCLGLLLGYIHFKSTNNTDVPTPVEKKVIDTLYLTRDSLIYRTKYLDSIKYDTIEKVYKLNDSNTLYLFLQLVSE